MIPWSCGVRLNLWFFLPDQVHWDLGKPCLLLCLLWLVLVIWVGMEISPLCWVLVDKIMIATLRKHRGDNWSFSLLLCRCLQFLFPNVNRGVKLSWNLIYRGIIVCHFIKVGNENRLFRSASIFNQFLELAFLILEKWSPNSLCQLSVSRWKAWPHSDDNPVSSRRTETFPCSESINWLQEQCYEDLGFKESINIGGENSITTRKPLQNGALSSNSFTVKKEITGSCQLVSVWKYAQHMFIT